MANHPINRMVNNLHHTTIFRIREVGVVDSVTKTIVYIQHNIEKYEQEFVFLNHTKSKMELEIRQEEYFNIPLRRG